MNPNDRVYHLDLDSEPDCSVTVFLPPLLNNMAIISLEPLYLLDLDIPLLESTLVEIFKGHDFDGNLDEKILPLRVRLLRLGLLGVGAQ